MTEQQAITGDSSGEQFAAATDPAANSIAPVAEAVPPVPEPAPEHDPVNGRFLAGNTRSIGAGLYSHRFQDALIPGQEALRAAIAEKRIEWITDLGGDPSFAQQDLVRRGLRLHVILDTLEENMEREGVMTTKGHTRAAVTLYLSVLDRLMKIYQQLGLERKQKRIESFAAAIAQEPAHE